jgi:aldehyde:ferredoxin oxidoreductase
MQPILRIDLTSRHIDELIVPRDLEAAYLGGATLAARLLYNYLLPPLDPLSPEAPLLFLTGSWQVCNLRQITSDSFMGRIKLRRVLGTRVANGGI